MLSRALSRAIPARNFWSSRCRCSSHYRHVAHPFPVLPMGFRQSIHAGSFDGGDVAREDGEQRTVAETAVQKGEKEPTKARDLSNYPTRQFTIKIKQPGTTTKSQVLEATLKVHTHLRDTPNQCLVILATPSFAKWLEDDVNFMPNFIWRVLRQDESSPNYHIDVLAAVVDNISPSADWIRPGSSIPPLEGFSVLQGKTDEILPGLWDRTNTKRGERGSPTKSSLTFFSDPGTSEGLRDLKVTLPLANTLFTNGRHSTLLVSEWKCEGSIWTKETNIEKFSQAVNITLPTTRLPTSIVGMQRAIPLTIPRRIVSGLGNIVRQLDLGAKEPGPASRELELIVPAYQQAARNKGVLHMSDEMRRSIPVWALVVPDHLTQEFISSSPTELVFDQEFERATYDHRYGGKPFTTVSRDPLTYWISRGAILCRVLSGGGGWGAKQGLLSLDPQITYNDVREVDLDLALNASVEEQQISTLGDLAKPGSHIQFFTRNFILQPTYIKEGFVHKGLQHLQPESWLWSSVFGTVPSTVDHPTAATVLENNQSEDKDNPSIGSGIGLLRGHFGAMSESGLFLNFKPSTPTSSTLPTDQFDTLTVSTKIDLPHNYVVHESKTLASSRFRESPTFRRLPSFRKSQKITRMPTKKRLRPTFRKIIGPRKTERQEHKLTIKKVLTV